MLKFTNILIIKVELCSAREPNELARVSNEPSRLPFLAR
jgi:hypothetical protein